MARKGQMISLKDHSKNHITYVTPGQAREMWSRNRALWICEHCYTANVEKRGCTGGAVKHNFLLISRDIASASPESSTTMGVKEIYGIIGCSSKDELNHPASEGFIASAWRKYKAWNEEHDTKAPMVVRNA